MTRSVITLLAFLFAPVQSGLAQWVNISEADRVYTDFAVIGQTIVVTNEGGNGEALLTSPDLGQSWQTTSPGIDRAGRATVATASGFVANLAGQKDHIGDASGMNWTDVDGPGSNVTSFFYDWTSRKLYAGTQSASLTMSTDDGRSWTNLPVPSLHDEITWVHARGDTILAGYNQYDGTTSRFTFLSTDGGLTFVDTGLGSTAAGFVAADGRLLVLTAAFSFTESAILKRSSDMGQTWEDVVQAPSREGALGAQVTPLRQKSLLFVEGQSIVYAPNDRIYVSHDDGASFVEYSEDLKDGGARGSAIRAMQIVGDDLYVLVVNSKNEAPTNSGFGLYRRPLSELGFDAASVAVESAELPRFDVSMYPNPARDLATFRFALPRSGQAGLTVYDLLGREVGRGDLGLVRAGPNAVSWDASLLPAGAYLVRVRVAGEHVTRILTVAR